MLKSLCRKRISQETRRAVSRFTGSHRLYSSGKHQDDLTEGENKLRSVLLAKFPQTSALEVTDISGGCGAMYEISIEAEEFRGHLTIAQHRLVNEALAEEIKRMHGLKIHTAVPKS